METVKVTRQWIHLPQPVKLRQVIHIQTENSRRKAEVIATKPGQALVQYVP